MMLRGNRKIGIPISQSRIGQPETPQEAPKDSNQYIELKKEYQQYIQFNKELEEQLEEVKHTKEKVVSDIMSHSKEPLKR